MPDPTTTPPATVDVFGTQVDPKDIAAQYVADADGWTDMPEARPRARCQAKADDPNTDRRVFVMSDGALRFDKTDVRIDEYPGQQFAPLRAENEARWAALDKAKAAGLATGGVVTRPVRLVGESGPELTEIPPGTEVTR